MTTTFVDVPLTTHATDVVKFFCNLIHEVLEQEKVTELYKSLVALVETNLPRLVEQILSKHETVLGLSKVSEVQSFFQSLVVLIIRLPANQIAECVTKYCTAITSSSKNAELRLKTLTILFNFIESGNSARAEIFQNLVVYSSKNELVDSVSPYFKFVHDWCRSWGFNKVESRKIFKVIFEAIQSTKLYSNSYLDAVVAYLKTYEGEKNQEEAFPVARFACVHAITLDSVVQFDNICDLSVVQALKSSKVKDDKNVYDLLTIFASQTYSDFEAFRKTNPQVFSQLGLDVGKCQNKMRLLTLATLAVGVNEITYEQVKEALQIEMDQVELWVIRAIYAKLITGKLSQLEQVITVSSCSRRAGKEVEWEALQQKVEAVRSNMHSLLEVIQRARSQVERPY